mmetsp:Transcript_6694/g.10562  ORF Transcript_6694/g.10562 Transcript_6694/m.10562 type:complete len:97 (-) Transcript_6694:859-1149(-)
MVHYQITKFAQQVSGVESLASTSNGSRVNSKIKNMKNCIFQISFIHHENGGHVTSSLLPGVRYLILMYALTPQTAITKNIQSARAARAIARDALLL